MFLETRSLVLVMIFSLIYCHYCVSSSIASPPKRLGSLLLQQYLLRDRLSVDIHGAERSSAFNTS